MLCLYCLTWFVRGQIKKNHKNVLPELLANILGYFCSSCDLTAWYFLIFYYNLYPESQAGKIYLLGTTIGVLKGNILRFIYNVLYVHTSIHYPLVSIMNMFSAATTLHAYVIMSKMVSSLIMYIYWQFCLFLSGPPITETTTVNASSLVPQPHHLNVGQLICIFLKP